MSKKIKAVIFDMDGLMFDTESLFSKVQTEIAKKRGKVFNLEIQNKMMGRKPFDAIKVMVDELGINEDPKKIARERDEAYLNLLKTDSKNMPGLFEFLDLLDKHEIKKAIASGSHHEWINILLEKFNIRDRFDVIISGQDVKIAKPAPEIYNKTVSALNLKSVECLVLEDAVNGIKAAKAAGCLAVAIPNQFTKHQNFSEADYVIGSLSDTALKNILEI